VPGLGFGNGAAAGAAAAPSAATAALAETGGPGGWSILLGLALIASGLVLRTRAHLVTAP
jgi:hypothetical protein